MNFNSFKADGMCLNDGIIEKRLYLKEIKRYIKNTRPSKLALTFLLLFFGYNYIIDHVFHFPPKYKNTINDENLPTFRQRDIKQIDELNKIKHSISVELRELENKQNKIQEDISNRQRSLTYVEQNVKKSQTEVEKLKREILQLKNEKHEALIPKVPAPARLLASVDDDVDLSPPINNNGCHMYNCFDYSRCSLYSQFPVYVYDSKVISAFPSPRTSFIVDVSDQIFAKSSYISQDPESACLYVVVIGETEQLANQQLFNTETLTNHLHSLPHWRGDGRNHLIVHLSKRFTSQNPLLGVDTGRAMIAQSNFVQNQFRNNFDLVVPVLMSRSEPSEDEDSLSSNYKWNGEALPPPQVPALRRYFMTFEGEWSEMGEAAPLVRHAQVMCTEA